MSNIKMPKPNEALREFFQNDEVFASLFNGYLFHGENVISSTALEPADWDLQDLQYTLTQIYAEQEPDDREIKNSILSLTGILAGDQKLYETMVNKEQGGSTKMCRALEKRDEEIIKRITAEKDAEMCKALKKRDEKYAKK